MPKKVIATKKVATKKVAAKPKAKVAPKALVYAPDKQSFWLQDGQVLNSLLALKAALEAMEKTVFAHHVNIEKNDFADWVDLVLGDGECALALRKAKTAKSAHTVVVKYLKLYQI